MPRRPWGSPCRAFPSRRAVPPRQRPLLPCGFDLERVAARRRMLVVRLSVCALDQEPRRGHEAHDRDRLEGTHLPALTETAGPSRELPRTPHPSAAHVTGLADHTAGSPASKLCSLRESVHAAFARRAGACAPSRRTTPGRCSPGVYALLEPSPPHPRVRSIARMPGEPDTPGRPRPAPVVERSASILRPRPSGPDGCARLAGRSTPTADVAHIRAPSRRRPCLSCPCHRGAATDRGGAARGFRGLKDMVVGRSP